MPKRYVSFLVLFLLAGCTRSPMRIPPTPAPIVPAPAFVTAPAEDAIPQFIAAERDASRSGDLALLTQLWAPDGRIVDTRGTDDPADDFVWPNRDAILDRYAVAVFPAPPPALDGLPEPAISAQGNAARAVNGSDQWRFANSGNRWWIAELRY
jgi:hypothetical protein